MTNKKIPQTAEKKKEGVVFDIWECREHGRFERSIKLVSIPRCPKCKTKKLFYCGQVAR